MSCFVPATDCLVLHLSESESEDLWVALGRPQAAFPAVQHGGLAAYKVSAAQLLAYHMDLWVGQDCESAVGKLNATVF